jgi:hypothetical protein
MSSIIRRGDIYHSGTFHGISVFGHGVFTGDEDGETYARQCRDGHACGLGVATDPDGSKAYAEHGPDGKLHGRWLARSRARNAVETTRYRLYERGKGKESADVSADGRCWYNFEGCAPDDPRLLALIAQVAPVEVRPAATPTIAAHSPP